MTSPTSKLRARLRLCASRSGRPPSCFSTRRRMADAQVVEGVQKGAREGNKAAGPVGGVLGGAIGGVVGVVTGVTGVLTGGNNRRTGARGKDAKQGEAAKQGELQQGMREGSQGRQGRRQAAGRC